MQIDITRHQAILNQVAGEQNEALQSATKWASDESLRALQQQDEVADLRAELSTANAALAEARRMISEINDENERLSAELVAKTDELAAMKKQRDEANANLRDAAREIAKMDSYRGDRTHAVEVAIQRGWRCFAQEGGGSNAG